MSLREELECQGNWIFRRRSYLPIIFLLCGYIVFFYNLYCPRYLYVLILAYFPTYRYFCLGISIFGLLIRLYTIGYTPSGTSGRNTHKQVAESLNTTGIYSIVRNPLYLGNFIIYLGISLLTCCASFILIFILGYWLYCERIIFAEEQFLLRKFGKDYKDWSENVPAFLPKLTGWLRPELGFSWKKVIRQEKNGIFAVFMIFLLFHLTEVQVLAHHAVDGVLVSCAIASGLIYFLLKLIKKRTTWLLQKDR